LGGREGRCDDAPPCAGAGWVLRSHSAATVLSLRHVVGIRHPPGRDLHVVVELDERRAGETARDRNADPTCPPRSSRPWQGWVENVEQVAIELNAQVGVERQAAAVTSQRFTRPSSRSSAPALLILSIEQIG
jgi:hypothetical protein